MQQYMECKSGSYTIRGTVYIPEQASAEHRVPMAVLCHGFTADRNETLFIHRRLAKLLCAAGIAALCFDFMGSGESDGTFEEMSVLTETADVLAVLDHVRTLDYVDADRVALHGMSQGGLVACLAAARKPQKICALSLWAPALSIPDMCRKGHLLKISLDKIEEIGYIDYQGIKLGSVYVRDALKTDVWEELRSYAGPILTVHGTADQTISYECSVKLRDCFSGQCVLKTVEGADHDFETISHNQQRLEHAVTFLKKQLL
ncbi:MAG: alpha/beta fold hydrolase [Clostridiales bacterium]|nr:alpha/beta fold hydrolase [Clostridiales bacterium]